MCCIRFLRLVKPYFAKKKLNFQWIHDSQKVSICRNKIHPKVSDIKIERMLASGRATSYSNIAE